jgi:CPA2 family monovalent cation:H+ antiporter-2
MMAHLPELIYDLGFILVAAAIVSLIFKRFKQPVVLGYLIAGVIVGSYLGTTDSLRTWAEIGVIFLLFGLGLEFSFKKLAQVGASVSVTAVFEVTMMLGLGFGAGVLLGWSKMDSLFLGGILSISSTTIIVRALDELGLKKRKFVRLVFGALIIEDIVAVLLLVLLSTVAVTRSFSGSELMMSALKLVGFVVIWFVLGIYFIPTFLQKMRLHLNEETTLIVAIGLCLMMVVIATKTGFSAPLGAFVMGSLLAETRDGRTIERLLGPVKNLFAAIFFVSVGMLINPKALFDYFPLILFLTTVTIIGKIISTALGALISGQSLRHSVQAGMSLAQIGEFSFIIATLGLTLNVTSEVLYPVAVAISALTTFTTPYLIRLADPLSLWIEKIIPLSLKEKMERYQAAVSHSNSQRLEGYWQINRSTVFLNFVLVSGIIFAARVYGIPFLIEHFGSDDVAAYLGVGLTLLLASPFLWALGFAVKGSSETSKPVSFLFSILRKGLVLSLIAVTIWQLLNFQKIHFLTSMGFCSLGLFFMWFTRPLYLRMEKIFISNLDDKQRSSHVHHPELAPWDASLVEYTLSPNSKFVAKTLFETELKEKFGVTIALIERGQKKIIAPNRHEFLFPYDKLFIIGNDEQLSQVQPLIEAEEESSRFDDFEIYGLESFKLTPDSYYRGKSIRHCGLREHVNGIIVGLERDGKRILSPDSSTILYPNDLVWIVGNKEKIRSLKASGA